MPPRVTTLSIVPVKGMQLLQVPRIELDRGGARGDRAFYVIDDRDRMVNGKRLGELQQVRARYLLEEEKLVLSLPGGQVVEDVVVRGEPIETRFLSAQRWARLVGGPFSDALSEYFGRPLRLVAPDGGGLDRGPTAAASLISRASLARLADVAGEPGVDARRFRMLIELDGVEPHAEDAWVGRELTVGGAHLKAGGNIGRCLVTSREPESGEIDLPTLDLLGDYRRHVPTTEPLPFGIHAQVLEPGPVAVGDPIELLD